MINSKESVPAPCLVAGEKLHGEHACSVVVSKNSRGVRLPEFVGVVCALDVNMVAVSFEVPTLGRFDHTLK
jgi:hypothetical protein